ncbi:hypothetical protein BDF14DRAFT_1490114 [Spinellus fusiger]|nr:hypothetical protein BDF14DRAFT_1490114 [Spinellus fusiger]
MNKGKLSHQKTITLLFSLFLGVPMSWKGVTKALSRLPYQLSNSKKDEGIAVSLSFFVLSNNATDLNFIGTVDKDFNGLEARFTAKTKEMEAFISHVKEFRNSLSSKWGWQVSIYSLH